MSVYAYPKSQVVYWFAVEFLVELCFECCENNVKKNIAKKYISGKKKRDSPQIQFISFHDVCCHFDVPNCGWLVVIL